MTIAPELLARIDAYWRAANYLSVGQIYLLDNPLLREPLRAEHIKPRLLGHWGTTPGQNFIYAHLNRVITRVRPRHDLHLGPGTRRTGARRQHLPGRHLQRGLSGGHPRRSRAEDAVPAVLVSRRHSEPRRAGDARQHPRRRRARVLAEPRVWRRVRQPRTHRRLRHRRRRSRDRTAGHGVALEQVPQPGHRRRGAADPAPERLQDRQPGGAGAHPARGAATAAARLRLGAVLRRRATTPRSMHRADGGDARPRRSQRYPRHPSTRRDERARVATALADDRPRHAEGLDRPARRRRTADRRHVPRAPGAAVRPAPQPGSPRAARAVDEELSAGGAVRRERRARRRAAPPRAGRARGAWAPIRTPTADCCCAICACRISATTRSRCPRPARSTPKTRASLGRFLRDVISLNAEARNFRMFGPDETVSNRLDAVFEVDGAPVDRATSDRTTSGWRPTGACMEMLSEHQCQGWLEGYLLTGRHGLFNTYEAFVHIVDSMFNQHAKWLKVTRGAAVAPADRVAELSALEPRLAAGSQRLHPPGSRASSTTRSTRRRKSSASTCRPTPTAC